ncbi:hypothetical protein MUK42_24610 [Musa troglodytarum]|uniref:Uncharacterized protein n=1 Tax=Musa troglodytarum TaxID=320322 RepID=A0A9E7GCM2_9LILI|nr:hypothetical protein MUK42_24610 [Musa troglodytarum]
MASGAADERNGDPARDRPDPPSRALPLHGHPRHPHRPRLQRPPRRLQRPRPPCRLALLAAASGLPLARPLLQFCRHLAATLLSAAACFPLLVRTSVACAYAGKKFRPADFFAAVRRTWRRLISTYLWVCASISACLACRAFAALGYPPEIVVYPALLTVLAFSMAYAHTIITCNLASVISVLEEVSGPRALLRSVRLIRGQTQAGLLMFLGSTIGMAFVEGLFEHRVKTLSHGDGSSRLWEAPLLVLMYSFVVLIDSMMSAVFYFTCRSSVMEESDEDGRALKGTQNASPQVDRY